MVELIVATAVIAVLVLMLAAVTNHTGALWRQTTAKAEQFREVRAGFEAMTARLADATLNTYWGYNDASNPKSYQRCSDLRFISGPAAEVIGSTGRGRERPTHCVFFQAPATDTAVPEFRGFGNLLSTRGYYVELNDDLDMRPPFLPEDEYPARYRYRLMELAQPVEANKIYTYTSGMPTYAGREWFREAISGAKPPVHVLAENVIALLITPRLAQADEVEVKGGTAQPDLSPIAPDYLYDTSPPTVTSLDGRYRDARLNPVHQLPPVVEVTMVAIDEASALRLDFYAATHDPFAISRRFRQSADYTKDLALAGAAESLENTLVEMHVSYRVFRTKVAIRGAKWSREQRNLPPGS
jgi:uncharacterized protein (TIGR02599 family)